jgi:TonB-linked SusC/RagA family outer membrane protein
MEHISLSKKPNRMNLNHIKIALLAGAMIAGIGRVSAQSQPAAKRSDTPSAEHVIPGTSAKVDRMLATSPVSAVTGDEISIPAANLNNMLFGRLPGLIVSQGNGEPGYDAATLNIRGAATYNNSSLPVYVDGFMTDMSYFQFLSPSEIESIEVLKDAAALAPLGMRGANGALWVTTKRGRAGLPQVRINLTGGIQQPMNLQKPLGTNEYTRLYNEALSNDNGNVWSPFYNEGNVASLPDVDWYDEVIRETTPFTNADVSVSGGDEKVRYFVLFGYMGQRGLYDTPTNDTLANSGINRYNIRTNLDMNLFDFLEAKVDVGGRIEDRRYPNRSAGDLWNELARYPSSIYPVRNDDGTWTGTPIYNFNPRASIEALGRNSTHDRTLQANFMLKERLDFLLEGLYVSQSMSLSNWTRDGASNTRNYSRWIDGVQQTTDNDSPYSRGEDYGQNQWNWQHYKGEIGYDGSCGSHNFSASAGVLYNVYKTDFNQNGAAGQLIEYRHMTVSGVVNYDFYRRYVVTVPFSFDGSDNYRPGNRWGFYPALGLGWVASNEEFMQGSHTVDFLKLRASAGKNGWDPMKEMRYLYEGYYNDRGGLNAGNTSHGWLGGTALGYLPNPDIFAETSVKYDAGIETRLWNKLDATVDLFLEKRSGIVTQDWMIPGASGVDNPPYRNIGKMTNKGFEVELTWSDRIGDLSYAISGMTSYNTNRIDYMAEVVTVPAAARTGNRLNAMFGYLADGFYDWENFDMSGNLKEDQPKPTFGMVQPGDIRYRDLNGDMMIDENDQTAIGDSYLPKMQYAFTLAAAFRGFDLFALLQGAAGRDVNLLDAPLQNVALRDNGNVYAIAKERWAYYPEQGIDTRRTATYPRLSLEGNSNNYLASTLWRRNGDFLKLRNVELGYTFTRPSLKKVGISGIRVYFSGINLLTVSELMREYDIDPEVLSGHTAMKSYNLGLTVTF